MKYLLLLVVLCLSYGVQAQETDIIAADSLLLASGQVDETAVKEQDSVALNKPQPVRPVRTLGQVSVIDT
jgi:hypothetical protein